LGLVCGDLGNVQIHDTRLKNVRGRDFKQNGSNPMSGSKVIRGQSGTFGEK
jgi:hypothetical protein